MDTREPSPVTRAQVADIRPDPQQPRQYFRGAAMKALAASIKSVGQRTPIEVRPLPAGDTHRYEIIDGERRWRACQAIGQKTIRICVEEDALPHQRQHLLSVISNFHREGHTHMEISNALAYQVDCAKEKGEKAVVDELADSLGKTSSWVYQYLALQKLTPKLQAAMHPEAPDKSRLRMNVAVVLSSLPAAKQLEALKQVNAVAPIARLQVARTLATEVTGKERVGKRRDIRIGFERFVVRLQSDMDRVMDLKQTEFVAALQQVPKAELELVREALDGCRQHLLFLAKAVDRVTAAKTRA
jgi:ParB family chromosome partitioning protein